MRSSSYWCALLSRCRYPPLGRQVDQTGIVGPTFYQPDILGVADRPLKVRTRQPDVLTNVLSPPPRVRAAGDEAVELGDERRCTLKSVSGDHQPVSSEE